MNEFLRGLREVKRTFFFVFLAFVIITLISSLLLVNKEAFIEELMLDFLEEKGDLIFDDPLQSFSFDGPAGNGEVIKISARGLLINNFRASVTSNLLGLLPFIYLPAFALIVNAFLLGAALTLARITMGLSWAQFFIWTILPHGIFELPALLLSISMGFYLCRQLSRKLRRKDHEPIFQLLRRQALVTIYLVLPLLVLAAFIESRITPYLILRVLG